MGRIRRTWLRVKQATQALFAPPMTHWGGSGRAAIDAAAGVGDGLSSSTVVAALGWLQRNFPEARLRLRRMAGDGMLSPEQHRLTDLVANPNPFYSGTALWQATLISYILDGNAYWQVVRNDQGAPVQLWWMPHAMVEPWREPGSPNFIDSFRFTGLGHPVHLAVDDVIHFRYGIDPSDNKRGMSRMRSLIGEVFTDDEAGRFTAALLRNMGVPGLIASPSGSDGVMGPARDEDVQEIKRRLEQATTGANRGKPIVIGAPTQIMQFGFSPEQMSLKELRRLPEERVTAVIGVPAIVCGLGAGLDRATYSNMAEARESAYEETVIPMQREFAEVLERQLLPQIEPRPDQVRLDFDLSEVRVLQEDQNRAATRITALVNAGVITVAEARQPFGLPVDDEHEIYLRPLNLIETPAAPKALPPGGGGTKAEQAAVHCEACGMDKDDCECPKANGSHPLAIVPARPKNLSRRQQARFIVAAELAARALIDPFAKRLVGHFEDLGRDAARAWSEVGGKQLGPVDDTLAQRALERLGIDDWQERVIGAEYARHYQQVAEAMFEVMGSQIGLVLDAPDTIAQQVIRVGGTRLGLVDIPGQTRSMMFEAIESARAEGLGAAEVERRIRQFVTNGGKQGSVSARATRIARSETMHAQRTSLLTSYEVSGAFDTVVMFDGRLGDASDDDCIARDGVEISFAQAEAEMESEVTHPNCTLSFAPGSIRRS